MDAAVISSYAFVEEERIVLRQPPQFNEKTPL
jgi:hypothetical protein